MASIESKVQAAFSLDDQTILASFHVDPANTPSWEPYKKLRAECRIVIEALHEAGATREADCFKKVAYDCLGNLEEPSPWADKYNWIEPDDSLLLSQG